MSSGFTLTYHKNSLKFLVKQTKESQERIAQSIRGLLEIPPQGDIKKLSGSELFRQRVGTFRILFRIDHAKKIVYIEAIGNRGDIYK